MPDSANTEERIMCAIGSPTFAPLSETYRVVIDIRRPGIGGTAPGGCTCDGAGNTCPGNNVGFLQYSSGAGWLMLKRAEPWIRLEYGLQTLGIGRNVDEMEHTVYARQE